MAPALRTQVYLTAEQRRRLDLLREERHKSLAELVREAVDAYLERSAPGAEEPLDRTFGSMPDLEVPSRSEWNRGYG